MRRRNTINFDKPSENKQLINITPTSNIFARDTTLPYSLLVINKNGSLISIVNLVRSPDGIRVI